MTILSFLHSMDTYVAEALGTGIVVLIGCMCAMEFSSIPVQLQVGFGFGFGYGASIVILGHISEVYFNPAIIVCAWLLKRITIRKAVAYLITQIIGSIIGYAILLFITPTNSRCDSLPCMACGNQLQNDVSVFQGLMAEFFCTLLLVSAVCSNWYPSTQQTTDSVPIKLALLISALVCAAGPYSSASLNPARSFSPALLNWNWKNHWIYWVGPLGGAITSTYLTKLFTLVRNKQRALQGTMAPK